MSKFFIPFGGREQDLYYQYIKILKDYIGGVYFSYKNCIDISDNDLRKNTKEFLISIKDIPIEKFFTINHPKFQISRNDIKEVDKAISEIGDLITGFSVSNMYVAEYINKINPNYKIDVSTNTLLHNPIQMIYWKKHCNLHSINVPRMYGRSITRLKEYKSFAEKYNIKIKLILNEMCILGCPFEIFCCDFNKKSYCEKYFQPENVLKSNWISPSYFKEIEEFIDYPKIVYRGRPAEQIFQCLMHYINGDDKINLFNLCFFPKFVNGEEGFMNSNFYIDKIPKKIFNCECKECYKCNICEKFVERYLKLTS